MLLSFIAFNDDDEKFENNCKIENEINLAGAAF
jgi:hypothetical protein